MNELQVERVGEKRVRLRGVNRLLAQCLAEVPAILEKRDLPRAHARLFPPLTADDAVANEEWQRLMQDDLRHLFVTAGEVLARDLTQLAVEAGTVEFAATHLTAWMNAINQARLVLGALHAVVETDMHLEELNPTDPRQMAILRIEVLGWVLGHLVAFAAGEPPREPSPPP